MGAGERGKSTRERDMDGLRATATGPRRPDARRQPSPMSD